MRACVLLLTLFTIALSDGLLRAQSAPLLPAVDVRRNLPLTNDVWPGDFNGDGITDLVGSRTNADGAGGLHVLPGRGDGTFGAPIVNSFVGRVIQVADFNGDRRPDVVVRPYPPALGAFILPGNGNGTLGAPRRVDSEFAAASVTADFTGDGRRDLVLTGTDVRVFPGNGDLTFGTPMRLPVSEFAVSPDCLESFYVAPPCGGAIAADFDNDGDRDLVVTDAQALQLFSNNGGLLFSARVITTGVEPTDVTAGDLDGDGVLDLVVSSGISIIGEQPPGIVATLKGNGNGTFQPAVRYDTGRGPYQVVVGDFTHDGQLDIATANRTYVLWENCGPFLQGSDSVSILAGNRGVFAAPTTFALEDQSIPVTDDNARFRGSVVSLNTSDLDRDRFPDLIVSEGAVLLTRPPAPNRPPTANAGPDASLFNPIFVNLIGAGSDPDHHLLEFEWSPTDFVFGSNAPSSLCTEHFGSGPQTYTLRVDDGNGARDEDSVVYTIRRTDTPPQVQIIRPTEGEVVPAGRPYTIRWTATDDTSLGRADITGFVQGMSRAFLIPECTAIAAAAMECTWRNPPPGNPVFITLTVSDTDGNEGEDSARFVVQGTPPPGGLPVGWTNQDIGAVGAAGSASFSADRFTVRGSGADIWGHSDEFQYAFRAEQFDFEFIARVESVQNVNRWTKAGIMIRENVGPASRHVSLFATPTTEKGIAFQRRPNDDVDSVHTPGPAIAPPVWLKITRVGDTLRAYQRHATIDPWAFVGEQVVVGLESRVLVGLAVSSHVDGRLATAVFSNVMVTPLVTWGPTPFSIGGSQASATFDTSRYSLDGSGADIWGTSDSFTMLTTNVTASSQTLSARVVSIENTDPWAKAGVMMRDTIATNSRHVMVIVSPGKGIAMQWRSQAGGPSMSTTPRPATAPAWVRLVRDFTTFTGYMSTDGVTWLTLGTVDIGMGNNVANGLVVTSHNAARVATGVFDDVRYVF
jgi:hypothetical protein